MKNNILHGTRCTVHGARPQNERTSLSCTLHRAPCTVHLFIALLIAISLTLGMNACKSGKIISHIALPEKNKNERLELITNLAPQYETLASNLNCAIKMGKNSKKMNIDGQLKIIKDQVIQLSLKIPILGEAFRLTLTPDKITVIDRINKQYLAESMQYIRQQAPFDFDFYSFQALLSNQLFIAGKNRINPEDYASFQIREDDYSAQITNTDTHNTGYAFNTDYTHRIQNTQIHKTGGNTQMTWTYANFEPAENKNLFPMNMKMELTLPGDVVEMNLSFKTININRTFNINNNYPEKYKQINLSEILKTINYLQ
jgi:hypothetical protein